ncbi:hypothetical protein Tco_1143282 [Tanacetum coccineum]
MIPPHQPQETPFPRMTIYFLFIVNFENLIVPVGTPPSQPSPPASKPSQTDLWHTLSSLHPSALHHHYFPPCISSPQPIIHVSLWSSVGTSQPVAVLLVAPSEHISTVVCTRESEKPSHATHLSISQIHTVNDSVWILFMIEEDEDISASGLSVNVERRLLTLYITTVIFS